MKKILSIITAFSIILCMTGTAFAAVTEDDPGDMPDIPAVSVSETDAGVTVSDMSVEEALGIVERAAEKADACEEVAGEVCGTELTEEEIEAIRIAIDLDKSTSDSGLRRDEAYFYSSADTQHGYYYDQLKDYQKEMYYAIGEACDSYLYSNRDGTDTSGFIDIISLDRSMPEVEVQQCYWTFFYSNPQYFFLPSAYSYGSVGSSSIIALRSHPECRDHTARHDMNDQINTLSAGWMTEVNKCSTDAEKVIKMAQLIADHTVYQSERDTEGKLYQTIMAVFIYQKAVCTSYAKSLLYLCDLAGIEGIVVTSKKSEAEAHAWTRLKLGGKWYEADPTWYDQTEHGLGYWDMWMNKSTATITAGDDLHYINTDFALYYGLTLPECNEDYNGEGPGPGPDPTSGKCGDNAEWEYEDSVLTITGSGDTDSFTDGVPWAAYADSITSVVIDGVSSVGDSAFSGCTGLRSVTLSDTLTSIGDKAFRGCAGITALSLPASLSPADIGEDAFAGCTGLSHIHIPYGSDVSDYTGTGGLPADADLYHVLTVSGYCDDISCPYGMYGHEDDDGKCGDDITWEYSGGTLTITGSGDMYDYNGDDMPWKEYRTSITVLSLPDGLTYIGKNAFAGLTGVSVLTINHPVTIGEDAFSGCTGLSHIHIPAGTADVYTGNYGLPADSTIYHELSENGCDDINCPAGLYDYSRVAVSFEVKGVFGGRVVTFNSSVPDARIYFSSQTSRPTEEHQYVTSGESVLFEDFYGTIYARTFINGVWGTSSRLILKIPVVKDPEISVSGNTAVISTVTPDCYIIYTTDGTAPALDNGKRVFGRASVDITAVPRLRAIAVRNCFTNSNEVEKTFDIRVSPPAFAVKGVFGGREVNFTTDTPGAVIYYTTENRSVLTTSDKHVQSGDTVLFTSYYGTVYARAYLNGKWSNVSKLILKIPTVSKVEAEQVRNTVYLKSSTPDSYIIYTTDGTAPSYGHGKMGKGTVQVALKPDMKIRVIAVRSGFSNSRELEINVR